MGGRGRWGVGIMLCGLMLVGGITESGSAPARQRHVPLAPDRAGVQFWSAQVRVDSQLLVARDLAEQEAANALPPCARTPAVDPPCVGWAVATATAMSAQVAAAGQLVVDAQTQISNDQAWLSAFQQKLQSDKAIDRGSRPGDRHAPSGGAGAGPGPVTR